MDPDLGGAALAGTLARIRTDAKRDIPAIARLYLTPVPPSDGHRLPRQTETWT